MTNSTRNAASSPSTAIPRPPTSPTWDCPRCSIAADISAQVAQQAFGALKGPIEMVTAPHTPVPFSPALEDLYIPSAAQIVAAAKRTLAH